MDVSKAVMSVAKQWYGIRFIHYCCTLPIPWGSVPYTMITCVPYSIAIALSSLHELVAELNVIGINHMTRHQSVWDSPAKLRRDREGKRGILSSSTSIFVEPGKSGKHLRQQSGRHDGSDRWSSSRQYIQIFPHSFKDFAKSIVVFKLFNICIQTKIEL